MQKCSKKNFLLNSFFIFLSFLSINVKAENPNNKTHLNIGVIIPLTGSYANFGIAGKAGIDLAINDLTQKESISIYYEDSENLPAKAVTAFNRLLADSHADIVIVLSTACSSAILPIAESRKIPLFMWTASDKLSKGHPHAIRLMSSGFEQGKVMAQELKGVSQENLVFFSGQGEFFQSITTGFWQNYPQENKKTTIEIPNDSVDFRSEITKAKSNGSKIFGVCLSTGQISTFIKQVSELYPEVKLFGCHSASSPDVARTLLDSKLDLWFVEGAVSKQFEERFKESNPETSGIWVAAAYYNIIQLISQNIEEYLKDPFMYQAELANKCVTKGAFNGKNCIIKESEDTYLDTELNVTRIHNGRFYRNPVS